MRAKTTQLFQAASRHSMRLLGGATLLAFGLALGGCEMTGLGDITGSIGNSREAWPTTESGWRAYAQEWGRRYESRPDDKTVAMNYATALRALAEHAQAVAVLQRLAARYPQDLPVLGAYGKALADAGRLQEAADVLERAHTPERPNWSILSAQGSVADQLGDHAKAQSYYAAALKIVPDQPQVLSNLGLSYALARQLPLAEATLQRAAAQPQADMRVRQNLALVFALEGKFSDAEAVARRDLAPIDAATNIASIRQMIAQSNTWREIQQLGAASGKQGSKRVAETTQRAQYQAATRNDPFALSMKRADAQ